LEIFDPDALDSLGQQKTIPITDLGRQKPSKMDFSILFIYMLC
jgi:hypothetical protein